MFPANTSSNTSSLPFYNKMQGTFNLPPLLPPSKASRLDLPALDRLTLDDTVIRRKSAHQRHTSTSSSNTSCSYSEGLAITGFSDSTPSSPSPLCSTFSTAPRHHQGPIAQSSPRISKTLQNKHASYAVPTSSTSSRTPGFKLVPQPPLDPSRRPITPSDALVVFPSRPVDDSSRSPCKAKLLMGSDINAYFAIKRQSSMPTPRAYAYKIVWDKRWSPSFVHAFAQAAGRRGSV